MRITTSMVMRNYQANLNSSLTGLESARRQVQSGRRYAYAYENPSAAASAAVLERRQARNDDYLNNVKNIQKWQDTQESVVTQMNDIAKEIGGNYILSALNDTASESGRKAYAASLREMQRSMVATLNTKHGDAFVMGGANGTEPPFKLSEDGKTLTYRGLDVNDPANEATFIELSKETAQVDLGFGLTFDANGQVVSSSAFDSAMPGINVVGYGKTKDGTTKNLVLLAGELAEELEKPSLDREAYEAKWGQFQAGTGELRNQFTKLGTKTVLLDSTKKRLEDQNIAITEQFNGAVGVDPAEAITNYSWAMYAYNTALKVGTNIISPSLLDFMK